MLKPSIFRDPLAAAPLVAGIVAFTGCSAGASGVVEGSQGAPPAAVPTASGMPATSAPSGTPSAPTPTGPDPTASRLALVYRGPVVGCEGCSEAIAAVLKNSKWGLDVRYVGPGEDIKLTAATLKTAAVYGQPGGDGDVGEANALVEQQVGGPNVIADWVKSGGRFYGSCMGGFLAAKPQAAYPKVSDSLWPGFGLLPGTTGEWIVTPDADVENAKDTVVKVLWRGAPRNVYFQDGPFFALDKASDATVLATYASNGLPAVVVAPLGAGKVGVSGPHLEADQSWFDESNVADPADPTGIHGHALDLADELIDTLMRK